MIREELISACTAAKKAYISLGDAETRRLIISAISDELSARKADIIAANREDVAAARENGLSDAMIDRLTLDGDRIEAIRKSVSDVNSLPEALKTDGVFIHANGMKIEKKHVPMGVIAMIYEARPNVTVDAAVLCIKSGNSVILRGGKEALKTNTVLVDAIHSAVNRAGADENCVYLIKDTSHESAEILMSMRGYVDLLIPRGGKRLIQSVCANAKVPVIETGAGNCHIYVEESADADKAVKIIHNAKVQRPSVCNAAEKVLIDEAAAPKLLPIITADLIAAGVRIRGCEKASAICPGIIPATDEDWDTEYNDYIIAVKVVGGIDEALEHIARHSTGHSEAIITENTEKAEKFLNSVDSAAVYVNASTRFTDGGEFGLGAEIGISTQKTHVRGPFALEALTTTKYIIHGNGQIR